ncbi:CpsB/CapC family capsule biosynthesis tyrosine phosphatase [Herbivorax sp. ANBcel31]|uniref:tyrosine-protein phosphatase n=1 Tax=Herbivorax sp. ANBcel31 TaxID=3069754 RepID=UPI0027B67944|nr:CpsB/CapC family capsule biosynthesis tyrosine phosphatase [Herbivorax sp. ANBcel31]MDQ2085671.1 CpsB/CapC family capsule biosynthesis tyrosine phosphatase [Herbivorax sp. ANBcel31]
MIDIHCHILNEVDDGPQSLDESVELCRKLKDAGISGIIATPHYIPGGGYMPTLKTIKTKMDKLKNVLEDKNIDMNIYPGMEVFADYDVVDRLKNNEIISLNDTKYILIEFPMDIVPKHASNVVFSLLVEGYIPIIAHPERYTSEYRKTGVLEDIIYNGALVQINSGSILGDHGKKVQKEAFTLINNEMVHIVASDSHGQHRLLKNKDYLETKLIKFCGLENTQRLMYTNPLQVLENKEVEYLNKVKKSFFLAELFKNIRYNT